MTQLSEISEWLASESVEAYLEGYSTARWYARRAAVCEVIKARFGEIPIVVIDGICITKDINELTKWLAVAAKANSLAEFRAAAGV